MPQRPKLLNSELELDFKLEMVGRRYISEKFSVTVNLAQQFLCFFSLFFLVSCNSEKAPDCIQNAGTLTRIEIETPGFSTITVFEQVNLVLIQGDEQKVEIESGEFLLQDISARVEDNRLVLRNENGCNLFREYGLSTVYVTAPNITEVRSSTGLQISSEGILEYPELRLISESFIEPDAATTSGSFDLEISGTQLSIVVNGISYFKLNGEVDELNVTIAAGDSRIEAEELRADRILLNHRGSNDVLVNPQQRISGVIRGYGDVISVNRPPEIEVDETFAGRLIFRD